MSTSDKVKYWNEFFLASLQNYWSLSKRAIDSLDSDWSSLDSDSQGRIKTKISLLLENSQPSKIIEAAANQADLMLDQLDNRVSNWGRF